MRTIAAAFLICALAAPTEAASSAPRVPATPIPAASAVRLITGFKQREPRDGEPATFETEARVAYDSTAMYVAVQALDPEPSRVVGIRTRRDEESPSDWIRVIVDSFHDRRSAFEFAVNPAGVKQDGYWYNDGNTDRGWDAVWDVAVSRGERGWRAEFRIPFSQLRFHAADAATLATAR